MTVQEVIDLARNAELKQLAVKDDTQALLGYINLGLLELYKRFPLEEAEAIITVQDGKTQYKLDGTDPDVQMDTTKELLVISGAFLFDGDTEKVYRMGINDEESTIGLTTPSFDTVEVVNAKAGQYVSIIYRVSPKFLTQTTDRIPLPPQFLEALLNYIGYRGHGSINGELKTENQSHYARFENSCRRILMDGLIPTEGLITRKMAERGFV